MTLAEKVAQLHTNSAPAIPRLGVQKYTYWSEGQHGINTLGADEQHGNTPGLPQATSFPTNFASSMSWDRSLLYRETTAISDEARGFLDKSLFGVGQNNLGPDASDYGSLTFWAPTVNLDRDPRWGRTDEAFGEDPYFVGQMAGAFVNGYEGNQPDGTSVNGYLKVAATAKHYALNNLDNTRTSSSSDASDTDIRQYYTAQFKSLIEDAHVSGLMTSYNAINGTPAATNTYTVNQLAQRTYGFGGYITSDCGAVGTGWQNPPNGHSWAPPGWTTSTTNGQVTWTNTLTGKQIAGPAGAQAYALRAGTGLNCTGDEATLPNIAQAIDAGILSEGVIDTALVRIFTVRMETGEFDPPAGNPYTKITKDTIQSPAHQALAEQVAANSLVLLKNSAVTGTAKPLLPADGARLNRVVILGDLANKVTLGGYSGDPSLQVNAVQGITDAVKAANPDASVTFDAAQTSTTATTDAVLSATTQDAIKAADLVIVFAGTDDRTAGEGHDRSSLAMPGNYDSLINQVAALGNPRTALVLQADGPVKIDDVAAKVPAIVFSGYNGESQGAALADVLLGQQNPSGHLNFTWYRDDSQVPPIANYGLTPADTGGLGRTYQYFAGTPTYPFGYGLSYTDFAYTNVAVDRKSVTANGSVNVSLDVKNTGTTPGATVAELYAATQFSEPGVTLPKKRLVGFQKTGVLAPGASQHLTIPVRISDLAFWDAAHSKDVVYDGSYQLQLGTSATAIVASPSVQVTGSLTPKVQYVTVQPESVVYNAGEAIDLLGKNRWIKDDTDPAKENRDLNVTADNVIEAVNNDESFADLTGARVQYASSDKSVATVSRSGMVRTVGDGVATISVTVNGVTGSTPIVVHNSLRADVAPVVAAGESVPATATFTNGGDTAVRQLDVTASAPAGWSVEPTSPTSFPRVDGRQSVRTTWTVTAPGDATQGSYAVTFTATTSTGRTFTAQAQVSVPYPSVTAAFDNAGISDDAAPGSASLDGGGLSYSAQTLATAGFTSGSPVTLHGITFNWPNAGEPDNIVAGGQTVPVTGSGTTLGILGASNNGTGSGTGTVVYTDGTTQQFPLAFADWWAADATPGTEIVATLPYINNGTGRTNQTVHLYYAGVALMPGKTVRYVSVPDVTPNGTVHNVAALHIFAMGVG